MAEHTREPDMRLEMLSQPRLLAAARAMVGQFAQRMGFSEGACGQISLAVDEALCNIINHGYERRTDGRIWLNLWGLDGCSSTLRIVIEDRAKQVDPAIIRSRDLEDIRPGGLGVHIIREVMDSVQYEQRESGGMRLSMSKQAPACCESAEHDPPGAGGARPAKSRGKTVEERT
jgi:anti-sigma regulatory factor (Ser/Thr protein kinase)